MINHHAIKLDSSHSWRYFEIHMSRVFFIPICSASTSMPAFIAQVPDHYHIFSQTWCVNKFYSFIKEFDENLSFGNGVGGGRRVWFISCILVIKNPTCQCGVICLHHYAEDQGEVKNFYEKNSSQGGIHHCLTFILIITLISSNEGHFIAQSASICVQ